MQTNTSNQELALFPGARVVFKDYAGFGRSSGWFHLDSWTPRDLSNEALFSVIELATMVPRTKRRVHAEALACEAEVKRR